MSVAVAPPATSSVLRSPSLTRSERTASSTPSIVHGMAAKAAPVADQLGQDSARFRTFSTFLPARTRLSLNNLLQKPSILHRFLLYTPWDDFRALAQASKESRNILRHPELKDVVLSRFVPGYSYCLRYADMQSFREVEVGFYHLDLFMASQQVSLHQFPAHALAILSALWPMPHQQAKSERFIALCQAHSRLVLLLQSLIHSSPLPLTEEPDDVRLQLRNGPQQPGRELVFPAPLSYFGNNLTAAEQSLARQPTKKKHGRFFSVSAASSRPPEDGTLTRSRSRISSTVFGRNKVPPPPPSADPLGLKLYAESWRGWRRALAASGSTSDDDEDLFRRPTRRFASQSSRSSVDNSLSSSRSRSSRIPESPPAAPMISSPHDIRMATSRLRAPILRVFHPCPELDQDAISACEAQLEDSGLWQHLSIGDVVCNLGYLPPEESSSSSEFSSEQNANTGLWLLFDGVQLVPYAPPATLPLAEPHLLPSPLYYTHITPVAVNPRLSLTLPRAEPQLSLVHLLTQVRSPHSPNGVARIKKYMWLAHLRARSRPGLGEGWHGEWVLEGEGTKEGRQSLIDALRGDASAEREWELVLEKSNSSRIWMRLLTDGPPPRHIRGATWS
ncbi:hypothetical protein BV25DRAFT_665226 [Artomyces pyxidatus]|uniref:Uncharacterized protein n=1 Tax=Artomyces pyxidatus TaxID=48021 RepID=A0ACB8T2F5_9AGAM|nr:hypothetical protein BV25DRAFT_665226 [Artomyces pyxidatus]